MQVPESNFFKNYFIICCDKYHYQKESDGSHFQIRVHLWRKPRLEVKGKPEAEITREC